MMFYELRSFPLIGSSLEYILFKVAEFVEEYEDNKDDWFVARMLKHLCWNPNGACTESYSISHGHKKEGENLLQ